MQEESKLAYQFALEVAKQLITLSTAIITLSIAFAKDVFKKTPSALARLALTLALLCYLASIRFGVGHIQALTGSLEWAAIERSAAVLDSGRATADAASTYLQPKSDRLRILARQYLSQTGVIIGESAKVDARRQIWLFFAGTSLVVVFVVLMLFGSPDPSAGLQAAATTGVRAPAPPHRDSP
jgi:hypothetical protein